MGFITQVEGLAFARSTVYPTKIGKEEYMNTGARR